MNVHFLSSAEKKELLAQLEEQFGIEELPYLLIETGKERIRAFSGALSKEELLDLAQLVNIEIIGLYIVRREHDVRLSFDATQLLNKQLKRNIVDITDEQLALWIRGHDLDTSRTLERNLPASAESKPFSTVLKNPKQAPDFNPQVLDTAAPRGTVIIRHNADFFGCGKSTGSRIANHVPKERRLRK